MAIDKAELATELEKNPEIEKIATDALTKKGFVIRDKATDTTFLDNFKKDVIEKEVKGETAKIYSQLDSDIESIYGVKRNQDEKTYDYNKRAAAAKLTDLNSKIEGYEKTIREKGDPTGVLQKKIEEIENRAKTTIEGYEAKLKTLQGDNDKATKSILLQQDYAELSKGFVKTLPAMFAVSSKYILDQALAGAVMKDNKLYVGDGLGGIKKDSLFKEITIADFLKTEFKDVIDVKREQGGAGSGKGGGRGDDIPDPSLINKDNFQMPASIKTQGDLMDALLEAGVARGTQAFNEIWDKFALGIERVKEGDKMIRKQVGKALPSR